MPLRQKSRTPSKVEIAWSLAGKGALTTSSTVTQDGLTRPFASQALASQRFTPLSQVPMQKSWTPGDCL